MSTSPSRAPDRRESASSPQPFPYDWADSAGSRTESRPSDGSHGDSVDPATREAETRAQGRAEGEAAARQQLEADMAQERSRISAAVLEFAKDRDAYMRRVEGEVVQLALSVARKILHREAQVDPLLLQGLVRISLERVERATSVVFRIHPAHAEQWRQHFRAYVDTTHAPEICEDASLPPDQCSIETSMGKVELGVEIQLKEIEQGLMDLLAARQETKA